MNAFGTQNNPGMNHANNNVTWRPQSVGSRIPPQQQQQHQQQNQQQNQQQKHQQTQRQSSSETCPNHDFIGGVGYTLCPCVTCNRNNRSVFVRANDFRSEHFTDLRTRIKFGMQDRFGPVEEVFQSPTTLITAFIVRFMDEASVGAALTFANGTMPEKALGVIIRPAIRSKWMSLEMGALVPPIRDEQNMVPPQYGYNASTESQVPAFQGGYAPMPQGQPNVHLSGFNGQPLVNANMNAAQYPFTRTYYPPPTGYAMQPAFNGPQQMQTQTQQQQRRESPPNHQQQAQAGVRNGFQKKGAVAHVDAAQANGGKKSRDGSPEKKRPRVALPERPKAGVEQGSKQTDSAPRLEEKSDDVSDAHDAVGQTLEMKSDSAPQSQEKQLDDTLQLQGTKSDDALQLEEKELDEIHQPQENNVARQSQDRNLDNVDQLQEKKSDDAPQPEENKSEASPVNNKVNLPDQETKLEPQPKTKPPESKPCRTSHARTASMYTNKEIDERKRVWARIPMPLDPRKTRAASMACHCEMESKVEDRIEDKIGAKIEAQIENKSESKSEDKVQEKTGDKTEVKIEAKNETKADTKPDDVVIEDASNESWCGEGILTPKSDSSIVADDKFEAVGLMRLVEGDEATGDAREATKQLTQTSKEVQSINQVVQPIEQTTQSIDQVTQPIEQVTQPTEQVTQTTEQVTQSIEQAPQSVEQVNQPVDQPIEQSSKPPRHKPNKSVSGKRAKDSVQTSRAATPVPVDDKEVSQPQAQAQTAAGTVRKKKKNNNKKKAKNTIEGPSTFAEMEQDIQAYIARASSLSRPYHTRQDTRQDSRQDSRQDLRHDSVGPSFDPYATILRSKRSLSISPTKRVHVEDFQQFCHQQQQFTSNPHSQDDANNVSGYRQTAGGSLRLKKHRKGRSFATQPPVAEERPDMPSSSAGTDTRSTTEVDWTHSPPDHSCPSTQYTIPSGLSRLNPRAKDFTSPDSSPVKLIGIFRPLRGNSNNEPTKPEVASSSTPAGKKAQTQTQTKTPKRNNNKAGKGKEPEAAAPKEPKTPERGGDKKAAKVNIEDWPSLPTPRAVNNARSPPSLWGKKSPESKASSPISQ